MKWTNERIFYIFFGIFIISFLTYITIQHFVTVDKFNNPNIEKRYSIAKVIDIRIGHRSSPSFKFMFNVNKKSIIASNKILENLDSIYQSDRTKKYIGKRFYVFYVVENPSKYNRLLLDKPVRDSVLKAPPEGWLEIP